MRRAVPSETLRDGSEPAEGLRFRAFRLPCFDLLADGALCRFVFSKVGFLLYR
jgi:hypothetical protein